MFEFGHWSYRLWCVHHQHTKLPSFLKSIFKLCWSSHFLDILGNVHLVVFRVNAWLNFQQDFTSILFKNEVKFWWRIQIIASILFKNEVKFLWLLQITTSILFKNEVKFWWRIQIIASILFKNEAKIVLMTNPTQNNIKIHKRATDASSWQSRLDSVRSRAILDLVGLQPGTLREVLL